MPQRPAREGRRAAQLRHEGQDTTYNVNVTVTSVNGSDVKFDMVETVDKNQVAHVISDKLFQQVGSRPDSVTCPDNLRGVEGATLRCQLTDGSKKYGINVTVTSVDAGDVNFDFKVETTPNSPAADRQWAAFLRSMSARAAANSARCAAEVSHDN